MQGNSNDVSTSCGNYDLLGVLQTNVENEQPRSAKIVRSNCLDRRNKDDLRHNGTIEHFVDNDNRGSAHARHISRVVRSELFNINNESCCDNKSSFQFVAQNKSNPMPREQANTTYNCETSCTKYIGRQRDQRLIQVSVINGLKSVDSKSILISTEGKAKVALLRNYTFSIAQSQQFKNSNNDKKANIFILGHRKNNSPRSRYIFGQSGALETKCTIEKDKKTEKGIENNYKNIKLSELLNSFTHKSCSNKASVKGNLKESDVVSKENKESVYKTVSLVSSGISTTQHSCSNCSGSDSSKSYCFKQRYNKENVLHNAVIYEGQLSEDAITKKEPNQDHSKESIHHSRLNYDNHIMPSKSPTTSSAESIQHDLIASESIFETDKLSNNNQNCAETPTDLAEKNQTLNSVSNNINNNALSDLSHKHETSKVEVEFQTIYKNKTQQLRSDKSNACSKSSRSDKQSLDCVKEVDKKEQDRIFEDDDVWATNNACPALPTPPPSAMKKRGSIGSGTKKQKVKFDLDVEVHVVPRDSNQPSPVNGISVEENDQDISLSPDIDGDDNFSLYSIGSDKEVLEDYIPINKNGGNFDITNTLQRLAINSNLTPFRVIKREDQNTAGRNIPIIPSGIYSGRRDSVDLLQVQEFLKQQAKVRALSSCSSHTDVTERIAKRALNVSLRNRANSTDAVSNISDKKYQLNSVPSTRYYNRFSADASRRVPRYTHLQLQRQYQEWEEKRKRKQHPLETKSTKSSKQKPAICSQNEPVTMTPVSIKSQGKSVNDLAFSIHNNADLLESNPHIVDRTSEVERNKRTQSAGTNVEHQRYRFGDVNSNLKSTTDYASYGSASLPQMLHPTHATRLPKQQTSKESTINSSFHQHNQQNFRNRPKTSDPAFFTQIKKYDTNFEKPAVNTENSLKRRLRKITEFRGKAFRFTDLSNNARDKLKTAHQSSASNTPNIHLNNNNRVGTRNYDAAFEQPPNRIDSTYNGFPKRSPKKYQSDHHNNKGNQGLDKKDFLSGLQEYDLSSISANAVSQKVNDDIERIYHQENIRSIQSRNSSRSRVTLSKSTPNSQENQATFPAVRLKALGLTIHNPIRPNTIQSLGDFPSRKDMVADHLKFAKRSAAAGSLVSPSDQPSNISANQRFSAIRQTNQNHDIFQLAQKGYNTLQTSGNERTAFILTPRIVA